MRALESGAVILRLQHIPTFCDMTQNPVLALLSSELFFYSDQDRSARKNRCQARGLCIAQSKKRSRIDADKLDHEALDPHPDEIQSRDFAHGAGSTQRLCSLPPQVPEDHRGGDSLIDRRRMHLLRRGHESVGEAHSPWQ